MAARAPELFDSFNPCFTGTSSHTSSPWNFASRFLLFQSLFYWNLLSYWKRAGQWFAAIEFQSLFYWNLLSYEVKRWKNILRFFGFNPCFTGTSSHTFSVFGKVLKGAVFQSLFYWNLLSYASIRQFYDFKFFSFNPCFTGTSSHTRALPAQLAMYFCFNPCFTGTSSHTRLN